MGLDIGDGGHECLHLCHHGLVLVGRRCDAGEVLLQLLFIFLFGSLYSRCQSGELTFFVGIRSGDAANDFINDDSGIG